MAKEDFCFTYYDGDAAKDVAHMNRLERGCYLDILHAQRKRGRLSLPDIKKVLGKDYETCWEAIEWVLKKDEAQQYYLQWLEDSIIKSKAHAKKQKENVAKRYQTATKPLPKEDLVLPKSDLVTPLEDGDGNKDEAEDVFQEGGTGEGIVPDMVEQFKLANPDYHVDKDSDYPAILEISKKIQKWKKIPGQITNEATGETVKFRWGELVEFIKSESHFSGYSLSQINRYFQSITLKFSNQRNGTHKKSPVNSAAVGRRQQGTYELLEKMRNRTSP
jgi:hypothetical protein